MDKPTKGIPTVYKGIRFRSRLEARWAAMFDLLEWPWQYEPFDLEGWIPDFIIPGAWSVLVEVKPVTIFPAHVAKEIEVATRDRGDDILIVGCTVPAGVDYARSFGWLGEFAEFTEHTSGLAWGEALFGRWTAGGGSIGFCHDEQSFHDRISGGYDGGCTGEIPFDPSETNDLWNRAGNLTQWRGKQSIVQS